MKLLMRHELRAMKGVRWETIPSLDGGDAYKVTINFDDRPIEPISQLVLARTLKTPNRCIKDTPTRSAEVVTQR